MLIRYRAEDFRPLAHLGGTTLGWPIGYDELEPWYQAAEELYAVHGDAAQDPTEPRHSGSYPFPPVPDEPAAEGQVVSHFAYTSLPDAIRACAPGAFPRVGFGSCSATDANA